MEVKKIVGSLYEFTDTAPKITKEDKTQLQRRKEQLEKELAVINEKLAKIENLEKVV
jgi:flagellar motility protein MotE (MotC chaperone)